MALYGFILATPNDLTRIDLGRHLSNGREIINGNFNVLFKNHYSYTLPEKKFINHHWLSGLVFFLIVKTFNFQTLTIFHIFILLIALLFLFKTIKANSSTNLALILTLVAVLIVSHRYDIRPESFGYLFLGYSLWQFTIIKKNKKIRKKQFFLLSLQQLLWVNLHISFVFAIYLSLIFTFTALLSDKFHPTEKKKLVYLTVTLTLLSLINPHTYQGLLTPFTIFNDYGYQVLENQDLLFLSKFFISPVMYLYLIFASLGLLFFIIDFKHSELDHKIINLSGILLGFMALRNLPIFCFFTLPIMAISLSRICQRLKKKIKIQNQKQNILVIISIIYLFISALVVSGKFSPLFSFKNRALAPAKEQFAAAEFFIKLNIKGKIFNNYDIGSYLIYTLYPDWQVFTDNRPEAYGKIFFQEQYIPMQISEKKWQELMNQYDFQSIFFSHLDLTDWGQAFLKARNLDPEWQLTYQDEYAVIFIKNLKK
jgi:hypothetical protein